MNKIDSFTVIVLLFGEFPKKSELINLFRKIFLDFSLLFFSDL